MNSHAERDGENIVKEAVHFYLREREYWSPTSLKVRRCNESYSACAACFPPPRFLLLIRTGLWNCAQVVIKCYLMESFFKSGVQIKDEHVPSSGKGRSRDLEKQTVEFKSRSHSRDEQRRCRWFQEECHRKICEVLSFEMCFYFNLNVYPGEPLMAEQMFFFKRFEKGFLLL